MQNIASVITNFIKSRQQKVTKNLEAAKLESLLTLKIDDKLISKIHASAAFSDTANTT